MPTPSKQNNRRQLDPASKLVAAIDELLLFVAEKEIKFNQAGCTHHFLNELERQRLFELEGAIIGLHAAVANGRLSFQPSVAKERDTVTPATGLRYWVQKDGMQLDPTFEWKTRLQSLRAAAQAIIDLDQNDSGQTGDGTSEARKPPKARVPKKTRRRKSRVAELLLILLEDRRNANLNCTELASQLKCSISAISRSFSHKEYGPKIMKIYRDFGVRPPGIHEI